MPTPPAPAHQPRIGVPPLPPVQQARVQEILDRFGVPPQEREAYLGALVAMIEQAVEAYLTERCKG